MNRKGKKSSVTKAQAMKNGQKKHGLFKFQLKNISATKKLKPTQKPSQLKALSNSHSQLKPQAVNSNNAQARISQKQQRQQRHKPRISWWLGIYAVIITVGLSTILGTVISLAGSFQPSTSQANSNTPTAIASNFKPQVKLENLFTITSWGREINPLKLQLEELSKQYPTLEPEIFLADLDTKGFVSIRGSNAIASASTIKLPILVAFFQDVDRGKIDLEEKLTMTKEVIAQGSGEMQKQPVGTKFSALETADKMMTISDNTATNMLIQRLGGIEALNQRFIKLGLTATKLRNPLPDLEGTNTTSPEDLGNLLVKIAHGKLISLRSRDRLLQIMRNIVRDTLLPQGLESGAIIAHKTGDIESVLADVGIIDMPSGKRYIAAILVKRPSNSLQAQEFIQQASRVAYQYFKHPQKSYF
ncbi:MAG: serine hydrolase [Waterburya sp.]